MNYTDINAKAIDKWVAEGWRWGIPIDHQTYLSAKQGKWGVLLTPTKIVSHDWFGDLKDKKLLGLASGGAQQIPIFCALGAKCTVLDYSDKQLASERAVADREGYAVQIVKHDMTQPLPFSDNSFDIIFHPVSNSYVEAVEPIFKECYRVLKKGGILLCGLDNGIGYMVDNDLKMIVNKMPFNPLKNKAHMAQLEADDAGIQFSHTIAEQLGGQLKAGFTLTHIEEDTDGEGRLHELNIPTFIMTRAVKL